MGGYEHSMGWLVVRAACALHLRLRERRGEVQSDECRTQDEQDAGRKTQGRFIRNNSNSQLRALASCVKSVVQVTCHM
jgi:hypothetical protein